MSISHRHLEMDLALGSSAKFYGSSRSIVRRIATNLPLAPCPRVHFQLHPFSAGPDFFNVSNEANVATLADVGWIEEEEETGGLGRNRAEGESGLFFRTHQRRPLKRQRSLPSMHQAEAVPQSQTVINNEAIQKISALETELAKLRAQIAQIVQAQEQSVQCTASAPGGPPVPPPMAPCPPPPPPPPPPPCPVPSLQRAYSAIDLIRERRGNKAEKNTVLDSVIKKADLPSMLDVLKDMSKVKLRSVKSQEDGTMKTKPTDPSDAAAMIAEALKRKFAHRYRSSDSECDSTVNSPLHENKPQVEAPVVGGS